MSFFDNYARHVSRLETKRYAEARQAVAKAIKYEFTPKLAIKWALTQVASTLARRISPKAKAYL
jgi:hypothetical protein